MISSKSRRQLFRGALASGLTIGLALAGSDPARAAQAASARGAQASAEFWEALKRDDVDAVQTGLLRGIDTNVRHPEFGPAIVMAAREGAWKTLTLLAKLTGTRIDATNKLNETALMLAAIRGNPDSVKLLLARGAQVNRPGWTPLHYAATGGNLEVLRLLLDHDAYIDAQSPNRTTPLMMAARHDRPDAVRLLVEGGADPGARNEAGMDAADYMQRNGKAELAAWLRERSADYVRRYGTLERPRTIEAIEEEKRRAQRQAAPRLPGARD
ncbi:MAG: ankyrin repeat domain-containing protein [Burkholderiaceae bacterium]|nr:ankyrin repeat domain-containing protein [Burkholderiaceae bacterium]